MDIKRQANKNRIIADIVKNTGISLYDVQRVVDYILKSMKEDLGDIAELDTPVQFGIASFDSMIKCYPGIVLIYSPADMGKTSVLKSIAKGLNKQGLAVLYIDAECKLYLHNLTELDGVYFVNASNIAAAKRLIQSRLIDAVIVDTISSIPANTMKAFMVTLRKYVPFIILGSQMRIDIDKHKLVPACSDGIQSTAHTHIFLTNSEKISFEMLDMRRVQFALMKYEKNNELIRMRNSFVIYDNYVDNFWSAVDKLHSNGYIRSSGSIKYLEEDKFNSYTELISNESLLNKFNDIFLKLMNLESFYGSTYSNTDRILQQMLNTRRKNQQDYLSDNEEQQLNTVCY